MRATKAEIYRLYHRHKGRLGYRRITLYLRRKGSPINHKTVFRLMKEMGIKSLIRVKKYRSYRGEAGKIVANVLARDFQADGPNQKWVTDLTEFKVRGEKRYISALLDLYNHEIISYQLSLRPVFKLVMTMLEKAAPSYQES
ncbi:IS3 family transposase [Siphonobacter sp. SORGH_AS_0500]|uniref:IS3 family transposase n=1 Tax=Siphonobacter sp. SORGH_AS_0500 TaxID=1864824 RepID=UPI0012FF0164|nr:IS3 family transposase [Siphonobacter sp. SORGH_AS_0500]